jgi:hypothetical protein
VNFGTSGSVVVVRIFEEDETASVASNCSKRLLTSPASKTTPSKNVIYYMKLNFKQQLK